MSAVNSKVGNNVDLFNYAQQSAKEFWNEYASTNM